ncbi:MAG: hypothetical protein JNM89_00625 [Hyphomicrobiaceae bacterium]|nr:hypothetical protein [Hyphomicrobiaceae bacterium]
MSGDRRAVRRESHGRCTTLPALLAALAVLFHCASCSAVLSQEIKATSQWVTTVVARRSPDAPLPVAEPDVNAVPSFAVAAPPAMSEQAAPALPHGDGHAVQSPGHSTMVFVPPLAGGLAEHLRFSFDPQMGLTLGMLAFVLATSLLRDFGAVVAAYAANLQSRQNRASRGRTVHWSDAEARAAREECSRLLDVASDYWRRAEPVVSRLQETSALRNFLMKELAEVTKRLSVVSTTRARGEGAVIVGAPAEYWITLRQRLRRTVRDLERIRATADAALSTVGGKNELPRVPETKAESLVVLGANREVDHDTLHRLVRALRQCWHPDLARSDEDRQYRNARIAQINVAYDILTGRRAEG